jgi:hypothetical protein
MGQQVFFSHRHIFVEAIAPLNLAFKGDKFLQFKNDLLPPIYLLLITYYLLLITSLKIAIDTPTINLNHGYPRQPSPQ